MVELKYFYLTMNMLAREVCWNVIPTLHVLYTLQTKEKKNISDIIKKLELLVIYGKIYAPPTSQS